MHKKAGRPLIHLSDSQIKKLENLIFKGFSDSAIAKALGISPRTFSTMKHRERWLYEILMEKLPTRKYTKRSDYWSKPRPFRKVLTGLDLYIWDD